MRQSIQRTANDLSALLTRISRRADGKMKEFRRETADALVSELAEVLPEADIAVSTATTRETITVTDENVVARQLGSLSIEPDKPVTRAIDALSNR